MHLPFRPTLWPTIITIPAFLLMVGLSLWQVQRLEWKTELLAERQSRLNAAPIDLPSPGSDPAQAEYKRVRLEGEFLHEKEFYLAARSLAGAPGYHILTPFQIADGTLILLDRGFVPPEKKLPSSREEGQSKGMARIDAILRLPKPKVWVQPENEPEKNVWFYIDLVKMAEKSGLSQLRKDIYAEVGPAPNPGGWPLGGQTRISLPNDHLQYALTWGLLALALIVIYVVYHLKREGKIK